MNQETLAIVRAYYRGWTTKQFDDAVRLLAHDLVVEVPINAYPDAASFAKALAQFGAMTTDVELLSELAGDHEAMLLYDMDVTGLGRLRVAEHFTIRDGAIARIRQVHDTTALRAAGFAG